MDSQAIKLPAAIFLMGPTASGKTGLAVELLKHLPIELISVDSALVYKGMDIGTAKPDAETLTKAPHHLIDLIEPTDTYSAAHFRKDALVLMAGITSKGRIPLLVGGTMLYFNALQGGLSQLPEANQAVRRRLDEEALTVGWATMHDKLAQIDPETAARLKTSDAQRIQRALEVFELSGKPMSVLYKETGQTALPYRLLKLALVPSDRGILHQRIADRFDAMLAQGFLDEVRRLRKHYPDLSPESPAMRCVGYRQALEFLDGMVEKTEFREKGIAATRQLAKRQLTWLRGMDDIIEIDSLNPAVNEIALESIIKSIKNNKL